MLEMSGLDKFLKGMEAAKSLPDDLIRMKLNFALPFAHQEITSKTPVWSGQALRNWVWSVGQPNTSSAKEALGTMDPGPTNSMPLGAEPRRAINQAAADETLAAISTRNPFKQFWLTNNSPDILDLEYGKLPTPSSSRSPRGMVRVTVQNLLLALEGGAKKK
ncbi:hypothetical protein RWE87_13280 [Sinorhizobium meliloti]|uniref:hypothetical protein n=1 Tax=Rhizobium meliloti TaxID=382 RepID=UPI00299E0954|nr:hypothetical protein [Sinorhizobium meliloti]